MISNTIIPLLNNMKTGDMHLNPSTCVSMSLKLRYPMVKKGIGDGHVFGSLVSMLCMPLEVIRGALYISPLPLKLTSRHLFNVRRL